MRQLSRRTDEQNQQLADQRENALHEQPYPSPADRALSNKPQVSDGHGHDFRKGHQAWSPEDASTSRATEADVDAEKPRAPRKRTSF